MVRQLAAIIVVGLLLSVGGGSLASACPVECDAEEAFGGGILDGPLGILDQYAYDTANAVDDQIRLFIYDVVHTPTGTDGAPLLEPPGSLPGGLAEDYCGAPCAGYRD